TSLAKARGRSRCTFRFAPIRWRTERDRKREAARRCIAIAGRLLFWNFAAVSFRSAPRIACAIAQIAAAACKPPEMEWTVCRAVIDKVQERPHPGGFGYVRNDRSPRPHRPRLRRRAAGARAARAAKGGDLSSRV